MQVLERTFNILNALAESGTDVGGAELSDRLGLHKSTTHRLLTVLASNRYVEKDTATGRYRLGWKLIELGTQALSRLDLRELARIHLKGLAEATGETAHLGILQQGEVISIANVESRRTLRTPATVGKRTPVHCTSQGKAMLAFLPSGIVQELTRRRRLKGYTPNTITSASRMQQELKTIREQGYAVDDEEFEEGLKCIGAPVRDRSGRVIAGISIAGPVPRLPERRMRHLVRLVIRAAEQLSAALGYSPAAEAPPYAAEADSPSKWEPGTMPVRPVARHSA